MSRILKTLYSSLQTKKILMHKTYHISCDLSNNSLQDRDNKYKERPCKKSAQNFKKPVSDHPQKFCGVDTYQLPLRFLRRPLLRNPS